MPTDSTSAADAADPTLAGVRFEDLRLIEPLLRAVRAEGYTRPTPIQEQAIPPVLAGRDVLGCAQTGTGKTAAFALPILQRLSAAKPPAGRRPVRVLVLSPTRELAAQIGESFSVYGRHTGVTNTVVFGGVGQDAQARALARGVDVLVATPGRLLDLMGQRLASFAALEVFVLDEADRMLDMGFLPDVKRVVAALPARRQTLFFSATMPPDIRALADTLLHEPVSVAVTPVASTAETVEQKVYFVDKSSKPGLLRHVLGDRAMTRVLVFSRTKHGANRVAEQLLRAGVGAEAIHGNKSQNARERALANFKSGRTRVLVATDIAARGIDVDGLTHVVNFDLPNIPESYVHRIGRTGRAGAAGIALSFCDDEEREYLIDIERLIRAHVPRVEEHPFAVAAPPPTDLDPRGRRPAPATQGTGGRGQGGRQGQGRGQGRAHAPGGRPHDGHAGAGVARAPRTHHAGGSQGRGSWPSGDGYAAQRPPAHQARPTHAAGPSAGATARPAGEGARGEQGAPAASTQNEASRPANALRPSRRRYGPRG